MGKNKVVYVCDHLRIDGRQSSEMEAEVKGKQEEG